MPHTTFEANWARAFQTPPTPPVVEAPPMKCQECTKCDGTGLITEYWEEPMTQSGGARVVPCDRC